MFKKLVYFGVAILLLITCKKNNVVVGSIASLDCSSATHSGTLIQGATTDGVSSIVSYSGGNGGVHSGQSVNSTGVTGLTATLEEGSFSNSDGTLTYVISGTPSGSGTASFELNIGGQNCTLTRTVNVLFGTVTSLNCGGAIHFGTLMEGVPVSGVSSTIPYDGGNGGFDNGQTVNSTGVAGLTATLSPGSFETGSGGVTYFISGTPSGNGTASFAINIGGKNCTLTRTVNMGPCGGLTTFVDARDGKTYSVVQIGSQCWMAENLDYTPSSGNSSCFNNSVASCNTYGRLYDWNTALTACPSGWHLPSGAEWTVLTNNLGGTSAAGGKMKSVTGWQSPNTGATNESGFSALPGGSQTNEGTFFNLGVSGYWWSTTEINANVVLTYYLRYENAIAHSFNISKSQLFSCRCVKD